MKRVMIVDDAIELGRTLQDALKLMHPDIPVMVMPSAEEALLESSRYAIDLLVTDLRLPGMSGYELIRKIRVRQPNVKVILITGLSPNDPMVLKKPDIAVDIFMRKPISANAFLDAVDQLIMEPKAQEPPAPVPALAPATAPLSKDSAETAKQALLKEMAAVMPGEAVAPKPEAVKKTGRLGSTGRLGAQPESPAPKPGDEGLSALLSRLRSSLGLISAMLLDERGHPVAQAGDLPELTLENQLISAMMSSLSASARLSYMLGVDASQSVQAYRGATVDLVLAPAGQYVILCALHPGRSALRLALVFEEMLSAQTEALAALEAMGLHVQSTAEIGAPEAMLAEMGAAETPEEEQLPLDILETPLGQDLHLEKFEELFTQKKTGRLKMADPDAFWDTAISDESSEVSNPGMLNWEQAQKLGLLPSEKE